MLTEQPQKKRSTGASVKQQQAKKPAAKSAAKAPVASAKSASTAKKAAPSGAKKQSAAASVNASAIKASPAKKAAAPKKAPSKKSALDAKKAAEKKALDAKKAAEKKAKEAEKKSAQEKKQAELAEAKALKAQEKLAEKEKKQAEKDAKKAEKQAKAEQRRKERAEKEPGFILRTIRSTYSSTVKNTVVAKEKKRFPVLIIAGTAATTALFMVIVASFMQISQIQSDMKQMEASIRELKDEERKLGMELEGRYSSNIISDAADMGLTGKYYQPHYLGDEKLTTEEIVEEENKEGEKKVNSLMSAFSQSFKKFLEFID